MTIDPTDLIADVASGDTDRVNAAIDRAAKPAARDRYDWFNKLLDGCKPLFDHDDGYVRQGALRLLEAAYPRLELRFVGAETDVLDGFDIADTTEQRERYIALLVPALDDEDGRVRKAAVRAMGILSTVLRADQIPHSERETLTEALETLCEQQPEERARHTRQAIDRLDPDPLAGLFE